MTLAFDRSAVPVYFITLFVLSGIATAALAETGNGEISIAKTGATRLLVSQAAISDATCELVVDESVGEGDVAEGKNSMAIQIEPGQYTVTPESTR